MTLKKSLSFLSALLLLIFLSPKYVAADATEEVQKRLKRLSPYEMDEVLWLARCIYSESNRADEQELVAWAVRNRVDSDYRGATYREVVLQPLQFSAFNNDSPRRAHILGLNQNDSGKTWLQALEIALDVYQADPIERPFSSETRHFYSPISMTNGRTPDWAKSARPLDSERLGIDPERFLFFDDIDEAGDPFLSMVPTPQKYIDAFQEETRKRIQPSSKKAPLRERMKPSGRVPRPARPRSAPRKGWE